MDIATKIAPSVFAFYMIVGANFIPELVGCRMQHLLKTNMLAKHTIGFLLVFFLIVLANPASTEQGILINIGATTLVYAWFLMTTRSPFELALVSILLLLIIYVMNAYKQRLEEEKLVERANRINSLQMYMALAAFLVSAVGFVVYILEKRAEYGRKFDVWTFLKGNTTCRHYTPAS